MEKYLSSAKVNAYPTAYRRQVTVNGVTTTYNPESHLTTEFNLTTLVTRLSDVDSFIIHYNSSTDIMTVCIKGYWFELTDVSTLRETDNALYANIKIEDLNASNSGNNASFHLPTLYSWKATSSVIFDNLDDGEFCGIKFTETSLETSTSSGIYSLCLLDSTGAVPEASRFKLSTNSIVNMHYDENGLPVIDTSDKSINRKLIIDGVENNNDGLIVANGFIAKRNADKKYIWWVDSNGNVINAQNQPQDNMATISGVNNAMISWNGTKWEADWSSAEGKRKYNTSSTLDGLSTTGAQEYQKINISYTDGVVTLTYNE